MIRRAFLFGALVLIAGGWWAFASRGETGLTLRVLDVGQGDAILLRTPNGTDVLVDTGPDRSVVDALGHYLPPGDDRIELLVLTHPHADHVGGVPSVLAHYAVDSVWESGARYDAAPARAAEQVIAGHRVPVRTVHAGDSSETPDGVRITVLAPIVPPSTQPVVRDDAARGGGLNDTSVVLRVTYPGFCALLMGDASATVESQLLANGSVTPCAVLKVGHHGSRFASSAPFLAAVHPQYALISVGRNSYGHPSLAALRRISEAGVSVLRTDQNGTLTVRFDRSVSASAERNLGP